VGKEGVCVGGIKKVWNLVRWVMSERTSTIECIVFNVCVGVCVCVCVCECECVSEHSCVSPSVISPCRADNIFKCCPY